MLTKILSELHRPDLPNVYDAAENIPKIAWKTGTSYGRKDAWSIGYNKTYTIAVWTGNFSGDGVADLSGASIATPLLFQLFNAIDIMQITNGYNLQKICPFVWFVLKQVKFQMIFAMSR